MLPAPIWPLAEHASFGQNCCDASIGSVVLFIIHSMPLDACFFQALLTFSPVSGGLPYHKAEISITIHNFRGFLSTFILSLKEVSGRKAKNNYHDYQGKPHE